MYTFDYQDRKIDRKSVAGVTVVREGSSLPLLSAAALQMKLGHSA